MIVRIPESRLDRCFRPDCTSQRIHWHSDAGGPIEHPESEPYATDQCLAAPRCLLPRPSVAGEPDRSASAPPADLVRSDGQRRIVWDGEEWVRAVEWQGVQERLCRAETEPARTLRIEVTEDDVDTALIAADYDLSLVTPNGQVRKDAFVMLASFAERLRARQWVDVPAEATIPVGMLHRDECVRQDGTMWAHEDVARVQISPEVRQDRVVCVPADRLDDLIYPEPPKDLASRLAERLDDSHGFHGPYFADQLRAALAAEGVESR